MQLTRQFFQMSPLPWRSHNYPCILGILLNDQNSQFWTGDFRIYCCICLLLVDYHLNHLELLFVVIVQFDIFVVVIEHKDVVNYCRLLIGSHHLINLIYMVVVLTSLLNCTSSFCMGPVYSPLILYIGFEDCLCRDSCSRVCITPC